MSEFNVKVVKLGAISKHPGADNLSITEVDGCPVILRTGEFQEGDSAIYVPIEAVVPLNQSCFEFLKDPNHPERTTARIKAKRLRGVFSMGLLVSVDALGCSANCSCKDGGMVGVDVSKTLGIVKYVEPEEQEAEGAAKVKGAWWKLVLAWMKHPIIMFQVTLQAYRTKKVRCANFLPVYDMESLRKYRGVLQPGEAVYVSEKIHGTNFRCGYHKGKFFVGSHRTFKGESATDLYWRAAIAYDLKNKLKLFPNLAVYGEIFGDKVQDLTYGAGRGETRLAVFDLYDTKTKRFLDYKNFIDVCWALDLPRVPELYWGAYDSATVDQLCDGKTKIPGADHIREGFVIKPMMERQVHGARVIFKMVGEKYLLRKGGTEKH